MSKTTEHGRRWMLNRIEGAASLAELDRIREGISDNYIRNAEIKSALYRRERALMARLS